LSYNPGVPASSDPRIISQGQILSNFQTINTVWSNNHMPLTGNNELVGMHRVLTMQPQSGDPTTASNQIGFYNKLDGSSIPELFFRPSSNGTPIQLTYPSLKTGLQSTNPDVYYPQQYTFMAGPFIVWAGIVTNSAGIPSGTTVSLTPGSNIYYVGVITTNTNYAANADISCIPTNISGASFQISHQTAATIKIISVYYLAIGI
jgi:hypothetical protein